MKKILSLLVTLSLLVYGTAALAQSTTPTSKEEVVYGLLDASGTVETLYVVNILSGGGDLTDYGDYTAVENLTDSATLTQNGDTITAQTDAERFYYQGTLQSKALPWNVTLTYTLDGQTITPDALAGQSGALGIRLNVVKNPEINETFFQNYTLQISVTLDSALCTAIQAENATIAEAAGAKQLTFTVLPGQEATYEIQANVHGFTMDGITINGVKMTMDLGLDADALSAQLTQLTDAIATLDSGAVDLQTGASQLAEGLTQYFGGVKTLTDGLSQLPDAASALDTGAIALRDGISGLTAQNETLLAAATALQQATFDTVNQQLSQSKSGLPELTVENYAQVLGSVTALADVKAQLDGVVQFANGLQSYLDGVAQLGDGATSLADGTSQLSTSVTDLPTSAETLNTSASELQTGADGLESGLTTYQEGTSELNTQTAAMAGELQTQIVTALSGITGEGDPVVSFVSEKNTNISALQFVLKTAPISLPQPEATPSPAAQTQSFWQKLTALFGF
jgi:putative membrane protein